MEKPTHRGSVDEDCSRGHLRLQRVAGAELVEADTVVRNISNTESAQTTQWQSSIECLGGSTIKATKRTTDTALTRPPTPEANVSQIPST